MRIKVDAGFDIRNSGRLSSWRHIPVSAMLKQYARARRSASSVREVQGVSMSDAQQPPPNLTVTELSKQVNVLAAKVNDLTAILSTLVALKDERDSEIIREYSDTTLWNRYLTNWRNRMNSAWETAHTVV